MFPRLFHPLGRVLGIALVQVTLAAGPVAAASPVAEILCETTERLRARLEGRMNQRRAGLGLRGPDQVMEVWTAPDGAWTMVLGNAGGTSCIVAMGEAWQGWGQGQADGRAPLPATGPVRHGPGRDPT